MFRDTETVSELAAEDGYATAHRMERIWRNCEKGGRGRFQAKASRGVGPVLWGISVFVQMNGATFHDPLPHVHNSSRTFYVSLLHQAGFLIIFEFRSRHDFYEIPAF